MIAPTKQAEIDVADCNAAPELWDRICTSLAEGRRLFVFADFDGTLSEIADVPGKAVLDEETHAALRRLSARRRVAVSVISGRSVDDVAARVGLPLTYAGDHGMEIHAPDFDFVQPEAAGFRMRVPELANRIRLASRQIPGALVEVKRFSVSVHYRQTPPPSVRALRDAVQECLADGSFEMRDGKCVLEVRPRISWDAGKAVAWLLERFGAHPSQALCIGDDQGDEDMFRRIPEGINVRVSADETERTAAQYHLHRTTVSGLLHGLADMAEGVGDRACA